VTSPGDIAMKYICVAHEQANYFQISGIALKQARHVFAHLVFPIRPVVPAFRTPVVQRMPDSLARKNLGQAVRGAAILPLAGTRAEVNVAGGKLSQNPGIAQIRQIIDWIVEIEIVVVHPVHEIANVVHSGHGEAAFNHIGMLKKRVGGVIRPERSAHRGNRDPRALAIVPYKGNDLLSKVRIEDGLYVTAVKRMRALVIKTEPIDGINAEDFYFSAVDEIGQCADHALAFQFRLVARARRKRENRLSPVAVDDDAKVEPQPRRMPAMIFALHIQSSHELRGKRVCQPTPDGGNGIEPGI